MSQVTVYSSNYCGSCLMVKEYLQLKDVPFVEKNVSADNNSKDELLSLGFDTTPVTVVGNVTIRGFDTRQLDLAIASLDK
ncbi:MAG: glutaredoxin domain-containing protein [Dehalococcoidia bacterium]